MKEQRLRELFDQQLQGTLSPADQAEWLRLLADPELDEMRRNLIDDAYEGLPVRHVMEPEAADELFRRTRAGSVNRDGASNSVGIPNRDGRLWIMRPVRVAAAAVIFFVLGTGVWWIFFRQPASAPRTAQSAKSADVPAPAVNRATITLGSGRKVYLDSAGNGALAQQGGARVVKLASGQVAYETSAAALANGELVYNTLTNPRGSQAVSLTLTDGTKVWLNAASSLRYPVAFTGSDRIVEITGEAYFEVAQDKNKPFRVKRGNTTVEVLGTHFNINAYDDEPTTNTTLLQGSVKVNSQLSGSTKFVILQPGQQAQLSRTDRLDKIDKVDMDAVVAWKNGTFQFKGASMQTVMRQLSRWYNVEISYEGAIPEHRFVGKVGRDYNLSEVLAVLEASDVHFKIEGQRIIVRP